MKQPLHKRITVAIVGPAASGKGTLARRLAEHFGMAFLDTGKLYRAVGYEVYMLGLIKDNQLTDEGQMMAVTIANQMTTAMTHHPALENEDVGRAASIVSAVPEVRTALLSFQQKIAASSEGAVLDGRDIGTVICPNAEVKLYITASAEARAERRFKEQQQKKYPAEYITILAEIKSRDERDSTRAIAPLKPAEDAVTIDTSQLDPQEVFQRACEVIERYLKTQPA